MATKPDAQGAETGKVSRDTMVKRFAAVRLETEELCRPLVTEDYVMQTSPDVSPPNWHLGHTTWFYERLLLEPYLPGYKPHYPLFNYIFNSYYESLGPRNDRERRGFLSRPTVQEVYDFRSAINRAMGDLIETVDEPHWPEIAAIIELGLNHEQQHQELLLMDVRHIFASNPLRPVYREAGDRKRAQGTLPAAMEFAEITGGVTQIGHGGGGFAYDNEGPRHRVFLDDFRLMTRLVTNGEFLVFIQEGGYDDPRWWLSDGWATIQERGWRAPQYWVNADGIWMVMTLRGYEPLVLDEPVCHVSYYEADAFARWAGRRLPTEGEWEHAVCSSGITPLTGNLLEERAWGPRPAKADHIAPDELRQMFGEVWEWTQSAYLAYPGYRQAAGPLGEYNGKFMSNQMVLRGGSFGTPRSHIRATYRNFFQCDKRWQFAGFRLADDA